MATVEAAQTLQTGHIGLNVTDLERSKQFYQQLFGFDVAKESYAAERAFVLLAHEGRLRRSLLYRS
jgi:lactoylglutathione lyase